MDGMNGRGPLGGQGGQGANNAGGNGGINLGDEIRNVVNQALRDGDFRDLNNQIRNSVNSAMQDIKAEFYKPGMRTGNTVRYTQNTYDRNGRQTGGYGHVTYTQNGVSNVNKIIGTNQAARNNVGRRAKSALAQAERDGIVKRVGAGGATALWIIGTVLLGTAGIIILAGGPFVAYSIIGIPGAITFFLGRRRAEMIKRLVTYFNLSKEKKYASIAELARVVGRPKSFVVKDIYKMMSNGMLPQSHIDETETYFILDSDTNEIYENMMMNHVAQEIKEEEEVKKDENGVPVVVVEGRKYVQQIRDANAAIPGEQISKELEDLSVIMERIFAYIEKHPEEEGSLRKFMDYYLPTTLKLVNAYKAFDAEPVQGDNIIKSKKEIEETIGTINNAFTRLYDDLYADTAMDISTDINVLNTLFAQDGLTNEELTGK